MRLFGRNNKKKTHQDFETFKSEISWFVTPNSKVKFQEQNEVSLSKEFTSTFPQLTYLISKSRQTYLKINGADYILFAWDTLNGQICGWLNQLGNEKEYKHELIDEH